MPNISRSVVLAAAGLATGLLTAVTCAHAVTVELKDVAPDRIERQRKAAEGALPLPGTPDLSRLPERLTAAGVKPGDDVLLRVFKAESELELWMKKGGSYVLFATYPICHWSGTLGPKIKEGDKQTPEGFYTVTRRQLHRAGRWPRSLNLGFPNAFDRSQARNGSYILVHGGCSSVGCFAMTNTVIEEVFNLTEAAIQAGQSNVPVHVFPFRMTEANLAQHKDSPWSPFWANIKQGYDSFERTRRPPQVSICDNKYVVHDAAPGEGGDAGPLGVCGATDAAIRALSRWSRAAALNPTSRLRPHLPSIRNLTNRLSPIRDLSAANAIAEAMNKALAERAEAEPVRFVMPRAVLGKTKGATRTATPRLRCSLELASCRKFAALLQQRKALARPTRQTRKAAARDDAPGRRS